VSIKERFKQLSPGFYLDAKEQVRSLDTQIGFWNKALDFLVHQADGKLVAGAVSATAKSAWDAPGWTARLKAAVDAVSPDWEGPLPEPYEPWHYTYVAASPEDE
jgi:hypothetical protein